MKVISLLALIFLTSVNAALAATGVVTGGVHIIRSHDVNVSLDWVQLQSVPSAGSCRTDAGLALFCLKDDERGKRHLSILMSAKIASRQVGIGYDESLVHSNGYCYVRYVDL